MRRYDVTDEAVLAATPAEIFSAIEDEATGRSHWWWPWLEIRRLNDIPYTRAGSRVRLTVDGKGHVDRSRTAVSFEAVVTEVEPNERIAVEYVAGDFRGHSEWVLEPVDDHRTHVIFRWVADPVGMMRWWARLVDVPRNHSRVVREGFTAMEIYIAQHRPPAAA